jgi:hypothetical protein
MISPFVQVVSVLLLAPIYLHRVWFLFGMGMYGVFLQVFSFFLFFFSEKRGERIGE